MTLTLLLACQEPFDEDRHDLLDFRIAGMRLRAGEPRALLWSGEGAWHATAPATTWEETSGGWSLRAEDTDGHVETGLLAVAEGAEDPVVDEIVRELDGDVATLSVGLGDTHVTHWMCQSGTFEETGPHATRWTAPGSGIWPILALHFDGRGGNGWTVIDVPVDVGPPWVEAGARLFPADVSEDAEGWLEATVEAADTPGGLILSDVSVAEAGDPFDFDAVVEGRIGRDEILGTRVRFEGKAVP
ncbi:MAG: hypothetical protein ACOZNI_05175 [Myxococcota bacterium]